MSMPKAARIGLGLLLVGAAIVVFIQGDAAPSLDTPAAEPNPEAKAKPRANTDVTPSPRSDPKPKTDARPEPTPDRPAPPARDTGEPFPRTAQSMLALSWQPAFCQTHRNKAECRDESPSSLQAQQFSLHGLWPDGCAYEGVSAKIKQLDQRGRWRDLPALKLRPDTKAALDKVMPGTRSMLDRHEWIKHGTCDGRDAQGYMQASIHLTEAVNNSALRELFVSRIGQTLTLAQARAAMDKSFGPGAGESLIMKCKGGMVQEVRLRLGRPLTLNTDMTKVLKRNNASSCRSGRIDAGG